MEDQLQEIRNNYIIRYYYTTCKYYVIRNYKQYETTCKMQLHVIATTCNIRILTERNYM